MIETIGKENINTRYNIHNLKVGDLFFYDNCIYIKTKDLEDDNGFPVNAICLEDGGCDFFNKNDIIIPLDATLTVQKRG